MIKNLILIAFIWSCSPLEIEDNYCVDITVVEEGTGFEISDFYLIVETCNGSKVANSNGSNNVEVKLAGGCDTRNVEVTVYSPRYNSKRVSFEESDFWCTSKTIELK